MLMIIYNIYIIYNHILNTTYNIIFINSAPMSHTDIV